MLRREDHEKAELSTLAPYACKAAETRGRRYPISPDALRTEFQRDRDRVIHCVAFRKLEFKTQVFHVHASDYHRTRITHTIEVAQIARTLSRALNLNVDLAEAIALGHDMGHTPFGHAGESAMKDCMKYHGGFEHNEQGLRVVELLEERYPDFPGLNLTYEVREGIIKHDTVYDKPSAPAEYDPTKGASLESQIVDLADEIAYSNADLDDALKMEMIVEEDLREVPWVWSHFEGAHKATGRNVREKFVKYRALGELYDAHVNDVLEHSTALIERSGVNSVEDVRSYPSRLIAFSPGFREQLTQLGRFLMKGVYTHPKNMVSSNKARHFVRVMFEHYLANQSQLPRKFQKRIPLDGEHRTICDYISGMTDRYLMEQYRASFMPEVMR